MTVTIKDVAKEAKVSVATVSRVLNGVPNINKEMRQRVEAAISDLGYKPNLLAKGLRNNVTNTIGVVVSDISDPFIIGVTRTAEKIVRAEGYSILVASTDGNEKKEKECLDMMLSKRVDGLIVSPTSEKILEILKEFHCAVVSFDRRILNHIYDTVYVDKEKAMYDAVNYLLKRGHTNIAMVSGEKKLSTNFDRYNGYMKAFFEQDKVARQGNFMFGDFSIEYGEKAFEELMRRENPPTAIVSGSAVLTQGILQQAKKMKMCIPEDISLIGFGTLSFQSLIEPQITYAKEMQEEIGEYIGKMILARMKNNKSEVKLKILESAIIEGNSVKILK